MSNENPFSNESNPFADPAIQRVTQSAQIAQQSLDDYNPFNQQNFQSKPAAIIPTASNNLPSQTTYTQQPTLTDQIIQPPAYTQTSAQKLNLTDIEKQQQELDKRAAELDRREQLLNAPVIGAKNFPPLPSWCPGPLKPCFYQDINLEIPVEFQRWVRLLFYLWIFHAFTLGFNVIAALVVLITTGSFMTFLFSIIYFIIFTPCSYVCWFRPAYKGFRNDSSINFMIFFFAFFLQCALSIIAVLSDEWFCGIILLIKVMSTTSVGNIVAGVFVLLTTICFIALASIDILMLIKIHRLYRNTGASFEKAQAEFATNVMSNKNVQNAAATVVTESARAAMQQQTANYGSSPGRF